MKKILLCALLFLPVAVIADTMCVRDSSLVISLDPTIVANGTGSDVINSVFWGNFPYGHIYGEATCLSAEEGLGRISGLGSFYGVGEYEKTLITAKKGLSGLDANGNERKYCWCRLTHPVASAWVFNREFTDCANDCLALYYGCRVQLGVIEGKNLRSGLYSSIGL